MGKQTDKIHYCKCYYGYRGQDAGAYSIHYVPEERKICFPTIGKPANYVMYKLGNSFDQFQGDIMVLDEVIPGKLFTYMQKALSYLTLEMHERCLISAAIVVWILHERLHKSNHTIKGINRYKWIPDVNSTFVTAEVFYEILIAILEEVKLQ